MRVHVPTTSLHLAHRNESESHSAVSDSFQLHGLCSPWDSPGQNTGVGSLSLHPGDLPNPGIEPESPTLQVDSLPAEPPGKPSFLENSGTEDQFSGKQCESKRDLAVTGLPAPVASWLE